MASPVVHSPRPGIWLAEAQVEDFEVRSALLVGEKEAAIWDTMARPSDMAWVEDLLPAMPFSVIYSHGDWDHVWGTFGLSSQWEAIVAHEFCARRFQEELPNTLNEKREAGPRDYSDVRLIPPTKTFRDDLIIDLGGLTLELHTLPGHTPDTVVGYVPELGTLLAGDAAENPLPFLNPGSPLRRWRLGLAEWADALDRWSESGDTSGETALVIPSHGPLQGTELLRQNVSYLLALESGVPPEVETGLPPFYAETHEANLRHAGVDSGSI